ncbi:glycosyltransferase family A protein [Pseudomonadales bacterium]|jgi:glycosyltransferase involved in cell wall biosynthesis|nr:glycosyltransferase family 2 protein [Pseudomonadales bacterium]MDB2449493.1 glycosyltransferase family 2 protein [Pseudomonadales bacterium]MDC1083174.1 glycosyltransferase family A protein [Pseudomonadales bacterium]MDC6449413.1 glycosyltransferase family A protein [Pseudomonadales bacterium]
MAKTMFSVCTPTYNRADFLQRVWQSLEKQSFRGFEWIIVDDGSTDTTWEVIEKIKSQCTFSLQYIKQSNRGKHAAVNRGAKGAKGFFFTILDSDDRYKPGALQSFADAYNNIDSTLQESILGVAALLEDETGTILGDKFPEDYWLSDNITAKYIESIRGDKISAVKTSIMREFPFPENIGKFSPESIAWNRMALKYDSIYINKVVGVAEYQEGGLTDSSLLIQIHNPLGTVIVCRELLASHHSFPFLTLAKLSVNFSRYALHTGSFWRQWLPLPGHYITLIITLPIALLKWSQDKLKLHHEQIE